MWGLVPEQFTLRELETTASLEDMLDAHRALETRRALGDHYRKKAETERKKEASR